MPSSSLWRQQIGHGTRHHTPQSRFRSAHVTRQSLKRLAARHQELNRYVALWITSSTPLVRLSGCPAVTPPPPQTPRRQRCLRPHHPPPAGERFLPVTAPTRDRRPHRRRNRSTIPSLAHRNPRTTMAARSRRRVVTKVIENGTVIPSYSRCPARTQYAWTAG